MSALPPQPRDCEVPGFGPAQKYAFNYMRLNNIARLYMWVKDDADRVFPYAFYVDGVGHELCQCCGDDTPYKPGAAFCRDCKFGDDP